VIEVAAVTDMGLWMVVPVRSLRDGKRRLAPLLDVSQRSALVRWLLDHTLEQAARFPGMSRTLVVTSCAEVSVRVAKQGIRVVAESPPCGLNGALSQARSTVASLGGSRLLVVSCDLPLLDADDLEQLATAASDGRLALAPDRSGQGTNALCVAVSHAFDFAFGPNSFSRHRAQADVLGLETVSVRRRGLSFDVDLPHDLDELAAIMEPDWMVERGMNRVHVWEAKKDDADEIQPVDKGAT
jgi:2-phospho-L-lactate guanylyltransferase